MKNFYNFNWFNRYQNISIINGVGINALTTNNAIGGVGVGVSQFTAAVDSKCRIGS